MKKIILSVSAALSISAVSAQVVNDNVYVGQSSTNNVFYSLQNDSITTASATNWHLGFASSASQFGSLTATIQFNTLTGKVYEVEGTDVTDFADVDTAGIAGWTPLYNSEVYLGGGGALNAAGGTHPDYGFGTYNSVSHSIDASRIFVAKIGTTYVKFMISLVTTQGKYELTFDNLSNTNTTTTDIVIAPYTSKNFVYFNLLTEQVIDREPASSSWDIMMGSYHSLVMGTMYPIAGILQNDGVEAVEVGSVDTETYVDFASHEFTDEMNTIGSDWKTHTGNGIYTVTPNTVYFMKAKNGEIWKVVMRGYEGGTAGKMSFSKEKMSALGVDENGKQIVASVYPNPAAEKATIVVSNMNGTIAVYSMTGALVQSIDVNAAGLATVELPVSELNNGVYQLVFTSGTATSVQRLVVQH